ncbi:hypothetical protein M153_2200029781 [Pseudoloma neurophilia]|uniref:Uncharacterized protein n=1 Tax=Pseudoloma neurophilia TaxID=146866 RepID=A0A0R0M0X6_9MICR|nr:hypothetical protein M153_2200029781 [Pseudoloma neurophilia]
MFVALYEQIIKSLNSQQHFQGSVKKTNLFVPVFESFSFSQNKSHVVILEFFRIITVFEI